MASSTVTSDETRAESVTKYLVLYDESCAGFREKLKQTWTDVAEEVGLENGLLYNTKIEHIYD